MNKTPSPKSRASGLRDRLRSDAVAVLLETHNELPAKLAAEDIVSRILTRYLEADRARYGYGGMHDRLYAYEKGFTIYPGKDARRALDSLLSARGE